MICVSPKIFRRSKLLPDNSYEKNIKSKFLSGIMIEFVIIWKIGDKQIICFLMRAKKG